MSRQRRRARTPGRSIPRPREGGTHIAVTGFAGPSTLEGGKVGEVFIAYAIQENVYCDEKRYIGNRERVQKQVTQEVLLKVAKAIMQIA